MTLARRKLIRIVLFFLVLAALLLATGALLAQVTTRSGERVEAGDVLTDLSFFAAESLTVTAKSGDDIFAAGREVSINEAQADHMIVAGGEIIITNTTIHDLVAAAGDIDLISGTVTDDLVSAAGDIDIRAEFNINGSAIVTGGEVTISAPIGGELRAAGARVLLNSAVTGDAHLTGEEIVLGPEARIGGDLHHRTRSIEIDPAAIVTGEIIELEPSPPPDLEEWSVKAAAAGAIFAIAFMAGMALLVIAIAAALPALMNSASAMIREKPLATIGIGFLVSVAAPVVIAFLFATIFGIPLALLIGVIYVAAAPLAIAAFAYFLGMQGRSAMTKNAGAPTGLARVMWSALAALALIIAGLIPILGGLFWLIAYIMGTGAIMTRGGKALALKA